MTAPTPLRDVTRPAAVTESGLISPSEWRVVVGLSRDLNLTEVAAQLEVAWDTARSHSRAVRERLRVHTSQGIVAECFRRGWLR